MTQAVDACRQRVVCRVCRSSAEGRGSRGAVARAWSRYLGGVGLLASTLMGCATLDASKPADQRTRRPLTWGDTTRIAVVRLPEISTPEFDVAVVPLPAAKLPPDSVMRAFAEPEEIEEEIEVQPIGSGTASYYGHRFAGRRTASGERFDPAGFTAAHRTLPFGSRVRVTNPKNGKSVIVRINDRGPFAHKRVIDLSYAAAQELELIRSGVGPVELELLQDAGEVTARN